MHAVHQDLPIVAVIVAAVLTGAGGGVVRDLLAGRRPIILRHEIYGVWAASAGFLIGLKIFRAICFYIYYLLSLLFCAYVPIQKAGACHRKKFIIQSSINLGSVESTDTPFLLKII